MGNFKLATSIHRQAQDRVLSHACAGFSGGPDFRGPGTFKIYRQSRKTVHCKVCGYYDRSCTAYNVLGELQLLVHANANKEC